MIKLGSSQPRVNWEPEPDKPIEYKEKDGKKYRVILEGDEDFSHIQSFTEKYKKGLLGKNKSLTMGLKKLNKYFGLRKQIMYCISGYSGSGKTSFVDNAFVLNPIEYLEALKDKTNFHILYFSMERSKDYKIARWISRQIFINERDKDGKGIIIPLETILGWVNTATPEQQVLIEKYFTYANNLLDKYVTIFELPTNPTGIYKAVRTFALSRGVWEEVIIRKKTGYEYFKKIYTSNDPDEFIEVIIDTIQIAKPEKKDDKFMMSPKETMDKVLEYCRGFRDELAYSPIIVSQNNRDIADSMRIKAGDVSPRLEDLLGTSSLATDSEVVLALFDCTRYKVPDPFGYDVGKLREGVDNNNPGSLKYRSLSILKNSYGAENIGVGLAYQPETGILMELPYKKYMTEEIYTSVLDNTYFLNFDLLS